MREYLAKYNKTNEQKVVRLIAQKNNTDLKGTPNGVFFQ